MQEHQGEEQERRDTDPGPGGLGQLRRETQHLPAPELFRDDCAIFPDVAKVRVRG